MKKVLLFVVVLLFPIIFSACTVPNNPESPEEEEPIETTYETSISNYDFEISSDNPSLNVIRITIIPNVDIKDFVINMKYADEEENTLGIDIARREQLNKDEKYQFVFDGNENLSSSNLKKLKKFLYTIEGTKTVVIPSVS